MKFDASNSLQVLMKSFVSIEFCKFSNIKTGGRYLRASIYNDVKNFKHRSNKVYHTGGYKIFNIIARERYFQVFQLNNITKVKH